MGDNTLSTLVTEVSYLLEPLEASVGSPPQARQFLAALGWDLPPAVNDIGLVGTDLTDLVDAALALTRSTDAEWNDVTVIAERIGKVVLEIGKVIDDVTTVMNGLGSLAGLPGDYLAKTHMDSELVPRLLEYLVVTYLEQHHHLLFQLLKLGGLVTLEPTPADPSTYQSAHVRLRLRLDRMGALLSPDRSWGQEVYGWGMPATDLQGLIANAGGVLGALGGSPVVGPLSRPLEEAVAGHPVPEADTAPMPALALTLLQGIAPDTYRVGVVLFGLRPSALGASDAGLGLMPHLSGSTDLEFPLPTASGRWSVVIDAAVDLTGGVVVLWRPNTGVQAQVGLFGGAGAPLANGNVALFLKYAVASPDVQTLLTLPGGTTLTLQGFKVGGGAQLTPQGIDAFGEADLQGAKLTISLGGADSFIGSLISAQSLAVDASLSLLYSQKHGLTVSGSAGFETAIAINASIGPFEIDTLHLAMNLSGKGLAIEASVDGGGALGPISASVQRIGVDLALEFTTGNLGPLDFQFGFKPPNGLGLALDAGPISGGGFISFDQDKGRYAGILALSLYGLSITAIGLLDTKLPDGQPGFSFLIIISVTFSGIQLGFGFTLNGVGGLCGINRTMVTDAIQSGLRHHALDAILFPPDPIKNAPQIISTLSTIYPPAQGRYVFGPILEIGWGTPTLVTAEIGVLIEVPAPIVIAILGQLAMALPDPDAPVVEIHVDVLGVIDFGQQLFSLDATIHDSRIVTFTITGDMAMRLSWGQDPSFLFSIGGFNPHYQVPPSFPALQRITLALDMSVVRLTLQSYLAVTSNTFQLGAHLELYIGAGSFNVYGWLGFDALIIFSPFSFIVDFTAGLALRAGTSTIMGISVTGELSGPTPWHAEGEAHVSILFFDIGVHVSVTIGDAQSNPLPAVDVWAQLQPAIQAQGNWSGALPPGAPRVVALAPPEKGSAPVLVDPAGTLTFRQKVVPLNQPITKFGEAVPDQQAEFDLAGVSLGGQDAPAATIDDEFAPGQFRHLSDGDKLSLPSFEPMTAGFTISDQAVDFGKQYDVDIEFETVIVDSPSASRRAARYALLRGHAVAMSRSGAAARGALFTEGIHGSDPVPGSAPAVTLDAETWVVAGVDDLAPRPDIASPSTKGAAFAALAAHLAANPADHGRLQVVPMHELQEAA